MPIAQLIQLLSAILALADTGSEIYTFLTGVVSRISAAQAAGTDLTASDWAVIDAAAASNLLKLKGYGSLTAALLQTPSNPATAVIVQDAAQADAAQAEV